MAINEIRTNKNELYELLKLISVIPEKVYKIDIDVKKELLIDIENRLIRISKTICGMIEANPNYNYPERYLPDKLFEYWVLRFSNQFTYNELQSLKNWIENSLKPAGVEKTKETEILENPYPLIFVSGKVYECFNLYVKNHILDFYKDYSYLKKRLENDKLIHKITDVNFLQFLIKLDLITNKDNEKFIKSDIKFRSLGSAYSENRENNFNIVFEGC